MSGPLPRNFPEGPVLVTGGAGFVGCNLADRIAAAGSEVIVLDDLSRAGVSRNLDWLAGRHPDRVRAIVADIRDPAALETATGEAGAVIHLAAQVAVTTSLVDPVADFGVNAAGTLALLEALRAQSAPPPLVFASTNKVYGDFAHWAWREEAARWTPADPDLAARGAGESQPLDLHTPYGCSKGVADQYVLDYARQFGLTASVLRMSCIYGPRQFGTEDQGWLAHFLLRMLRGEAITLYGDGRQVRDICHVSDAVDAYLALLAAPDRAAGQAFNLGGGPDNAVSLLELLEAAETLLDRPAELRHEPVRAGDQRWFVADTGRLRDAVGWQPRIGWREGLRDLAVWLETLAASREQESAA